MQSTRHLAEELTRHRHPASAPTVAALLREAGYSLQANVKPREGVGHPNRHVQFLYINDAVRRFLSDHQPAISVDTKKKELVGDFKKDERERHPRGEPEQVRVHDFRDKTKGKAIPRGIDDILNNQGWVSVGIGHDTAQFAANSIRRWWREMGRRRFPHDSRQGVLAHCLALRDQNPVDARRAIAPRALLVRRLERSRQLRATLRLGANRPHQRRVVAAGRDRQRPAHRLDREPVAMLVNPFESRAEAIQNIA